MLVFIYFILMICNEVGRLMMGLDSAEQKREGEERKRKGGLELVNHENGEKNDEENGMSDGMVCQNHIEEDLVKLLEVISIY